MKYFERFWIDQKNIPQALYEKIVQVKPDCRHKDHFLIESQPSDEVNVVLIKRLINLCEQYSVPRTAAGELGTYDHVIVRHYEADDLQVAPFLMLETQNRMFRDRLDRDEHGRLMLPAKNATATIKIASSMLESLYVASSAARKVLEAGQLTGLLFREIILKGTSANATSEPFWEIESNLKMPSMVNAALNPHSKEPCYLLVEPPYRNAEPRYRQREIQALGDFDIARTLERLGSSHCLIISQRFYQHCLKNKIQLVARPVRIDPD